ncbi:hypothetical protein GFH48_00095 [Streptomyces fagopyri]|uniref:Uncharacterized protein n=1 Tax=Streptomyces fagopyri TaxID=2662397 RepID=A0A5Q0L4P4_9ACTN|nr:hypothetical protein [Streptomyces fagopyri]QFZ71891.1 hypothetical protein GFH48_00095 [Streptomyces fagopyri]
MSTLGVALILATACTGGGRPSMAGERSPTVTARTASPQSTTALQESVIERARSTLLAAMSTKDLPGPAGTATAGVGPGSALFVWATADGRFCSGSGASNGGSATSSCTASPGDTAFSPDPKIVPLVTMVAIGTSQNLVIGADRETVQAVTCNGTPLAFRRLAAVLDGRRALYAFDLPGRTGGSVTVTVSRAHTTATEHVDLLWDRHRSSPSCR